MKILSITFDYQTLSPGIGGIVAVLSHAGPMIRLSVCSLASDPYPQSIAFPTAGVALNFALHVLLKYHLHHLAAAGKNILKTTTPLHQHFQKPSWRLAFIISILPWHRIGITDLPV